MQIELFSLLVDTQRLSASVFRQLEETPLWTLERGRDSSLELLGHVRYKVGKNNLWALAVRGERLVRCPLFPQKISHQEYEREIAGLRANVQNFGTSGTLGTFWQDLLNAKVKQRDREEERHSAHAEAEAMVQLFLGLR